MAICLATQESKCRAMESLAGPMMLWMTGEIAIVLVLR